MSLWAKQKSIFYTSHNEEHSVSSCVFYEIGIAKPKQLCFNRWMLGRLIHISFQFFSCLSALIFFFLDGVILDNRSNNSTVCCPESLCFPTAQEGLGWPSALVSLLQIQAALIQARILCIRTPCDFLSIPRDPEKVPFSAWYVSFLLLQLIVWSTLIKTS